MFLSATPGAPALHTFHRSLLPTHLIKIGVINKLLIKSEDSKLFQKAGKGLSDDKAPIWIITAILLEKNQEFGLVGFYNISKSHIHLKRETKESLVKERLLIVAIT